MSRNSREEQAKFLKSLEIAMERTGPNLRAEVNVPRTAREQGKPYLKREREEL